MPTKSKWPQTKTNQNLRRKLKTQRTVKQKRAPSKKPPLRIKILMSNLRITRMSKTKARTPANNKPIQALRHPSQKHPRTALIPENKRKDRMRQKPIWLKKPMTIQKQITEPPTGIPKKVSKSPALNLMRHQPKTLHLTTKTQCRKRTK
ncbi:MAG: hypothetical protein CMH56_16070 [Myxococcales bacterium]|nr:hypothetical protein [Myxococcales bacterium]